MNKKGFLLAEETIKIVIALICIGFLVYFLVSLYFNSSNNKKLEFAKTSSEHIIEQFESGENEIEIYNPEGWFVFSFKEDKNYVCICEFSYRESCDFKKNCVETKELIQFEQGDAVKIEKAPLKLNILEEK